MSQNWDKFWAEQRIKFAQGSLISAKDHQEQSVFYKEFGVNEFSADTLRMYISIMEIAIEKKDNRGVGYRRMVDEITRIVKQPDLYGQMHTTTPHAAQAFWALFSAFSQLNQALEQQALSRYPLSLAQKNSV